MKIIIENTSRTIDVNGIECRLWDGETSSGIPVHCLIVRIAVNNENNQAEFERELKTMLQPSEASNLAFPSMRLTV